MKITIVAGARPNFMKIAPLIHAIERQKTKVTRQKSSEHCLEYRLVHTGQHYDPKLSETFFEELGIPKPDVNLEVGSGTQAEQTAGIMLGFEKELMAHPSDLVIVVGDVTSTMACSITAKKLNTKVAHIEAGIRSFDLTMPEEINRMVTDSITDLFFTTSHFANENLKKAGVPDDHVFFVGNVMIDTLLANRHRFIKPAIWDEEGFREKEYIVITLHRPVNVDEPDNLRRLLEAITDAAKGLPVIFPVHPRTRKVINDFSRAVPDSLRDRDLASPSSPLARFGSSSLNLRSGVPTSIHLTEPLGYLEFNFLVEKAFAVITDSGGITEETTVMGVPCLTLRDSTERPETITVGTNELIGTDPAAIKPAMEKLFAAGWKKGGVPELWDGHAAERIVEILLRWKGDTVER
jgi:UDP-N-acetylglucosamine 2-epimerase (non-hydrolysing)